MSTTPTRFSSVRWLQLAMSCAAILGGAALFVLALLGDGNAPDAIMVGAGGVLIFLGASTLTSMAVLLKIEGTAYRQLEALRDANEYMAKQLARLDMISENTRISDAAKSLSHRQEEMDELRKAIGEDVRNQRWDAAFGLVREIELRFGNAGEAQRMREDLVAARREAMEEKLAEAVEMIESHFVERAWDRAQREIDRLTNVLPDDDRVLGLQQRMRQHQLQHKQELMREWNEAVSRSDTDHAIEVLRRLDPYLTDEEVPQLQDTARTVFKEKLIQLGIQFRFAVKEKRWHDALDTGLELVRDFPNTRMAQEVRDSLDALRERARPAPARPTEPARSA